MEPIKRFSVVDSVVEAMLKAIENGKFIPGHKIPSERILTQEFGVSRTALREAFQKLEQLGTITIRQGDGTYLNPPAPESLYGEIKHAFDLGRSGMNQFLEARESVELTAVHMATERITLEELGILKQLLKEQEENLTNTSVFMELDFKFHHVLVQAAKNDLILQFWLSIVPLIKEQQARMSTVPGMANRAFNHHQKLVDSITRRETRKAQNIIREHFGMVLGDLLTKVSLRLGSSNKQTTTDNDKIE